MALLDDAALGEWERTLLANEGRVEGLVRAYLDRRKRRVVERVAGASSRRAVERGGRVDLAAAVSDVNDVEQLRSDVRGVLAEMIVDSSRRADPALESVPLDDAELAAELDLLVQLVIDAARSVDDRIVTAVTKRAGLTETKASITDFAARVGRLYDEFAVGAASRAAGRVGAAASNAGAWLAGRRAAGGATGATLASRTWVTVGDDRVRDTHRAAEGQQRGEFEPFVVGGERLRYPGDPRGSPAVTFNCRCTLLLTFNLQF